MSWPAFLARRLLRLMLLLLGMTTLLFALSHWLPTDPVVANLGQSASQNPEIVAAFKAKWGLDLPLQQQFFSYLGNLVSGELGRSITTGRPVLQDLAQYLPATIELATTALFISLLAGLPLGVLAATHQNKIWDHISRLVSLLGVSAPVFWLGILLLSIFYFQLGWLPGSGRLSIGTTAPAGPTGFYLIDSLIAGNLSLLGDTALHLILPAFALASYITGLVIRVTRAEVLSVMQKDYVRTARAKGLSETRILLQQVLRNALTAPVTILGLAYGHLLSGAVLAEVIFAWPGIGRYAFNAAAKLDFPAILGTALVIALSYSLVNLFVDLLYLWLDPRITEV
ncbi:ABC transporter permease [Candidatus Acetothermia bacterium]|nr:ABC transporter permease [Candidatus Acetothermia bacterium]